jgi:hypothetical protein
MNSPRGSTALFAGFLAARMVLTIVVIGWAECPIYVPSIRV